MIERYSRPEMAAIWTLENKFKKWLEIEIYACEAWAELDVIPKAAVDRIREHASFSVERILELEAVTRHDVVAFTRCVAESLGDESKYLHYGLTSSDVVDTALAALMTEAVDLLLGDVQRLLTALKDKAREHKLTVMMGRTHGVHAEPTTFGLKMALYVAEMQRNLARLEQARATIAYGKLSGAVGTFANIPPLWKYVCTKLLKPAISPRSSNGTAEFMTALITAGTQVGHQIHALRKLKQRSGRALLRWTERFVGHAHNEPVSCEQSAGSPGWSGPTPWQH